MTSTRRTQAERRAATRAAVLESARRLFGRKGYAETSLEEIAAEAGVTIRPIYHYFGSKLDLFRSVNESMEERILASLQVEDDADVDGDRAAWRRYLELCEDPEFRQIVLVDGPSVLGRERWATSEVTRTVEARLGGPSDGPAGTPNVAARMLIGAMAEAALAIAESDDPSQTGREAERLVGALLPALALYAKENGS